VATLDDGAGASQAGDVSLEDLGWSPAWAQAAQDAGNAGDDLVPARVGIEHRGAYEVMDGTGTRWAELPGRAYFDARDKRELPAVGDWVLLDPSALPRGAAPGLGPSLPLASADIDPGAVASADVPADAARAGGALADGVSIIRAILPRRSLLVRRAAGIKTVPQTIAANVDVGFIVTSANAELNPRRLERYLVVLREGGVRPVIVVSKADLVDDIAPVLAEIAAAAPGVAVAVTSATTGRADELVAHLGRGVTGIMVGSSGVGKSTLLNALAGRALAPTQPIRESDARGRHTTTRRELFVLPDAGVLIDTPGMRELALWSDDDEADFDDIEDLASQCRFADCRHHAEPGCAVRAAVDAGTLDSARLASYHKLGAELAAEERRRDEAARGEDRRRAKVAQRALRSRLKDKGRGDD